MSAIHPIHEISHKARSPVASIKFLDWSCSRRYRLEKSHAGEHILYGCRDGTISVASLETKTVLMTTGGDTTREAVIAVNSVESTTGAHHFIAQHKGGSIVVWDEQMTKQIAEIESHSYSYAPMCILDSNNTYCQSTTDHAPSPARSSQLLCPVGAPDSAVGLFDLRAATGSTKGSTGDRPPTAADILFEAPDNVVDDTGMSRPAGMVGAVVTLENAVCGGNYFAVGYEASIAAVYDVRMPNGPCSDPVVFSSTDAITAGTAARSQLWFGDCEGHIHCCVVKNGGKLRYKESLLNQTVPPGLDGHPLRDLVHSADNRRGIAVLACRGDARVIAAGCWDSRLRLFDVKTRLIAGPALQHHKASILSIDFSSTNGCIATASEDGSMAIWNVFADTFEQPQGDQGVTIAGD